MAVLADPKKPLVIPQYSTVATVSSDSGGNTLSSKYICYNGNHPASPTSCANPPTAPGYSVTETDEWTYVPGVANPSLKVALLDQYLRVVDVKTYDFGGAVGGANYDTDAQTAYGSWNGTSCAPISITYSGWGGNNVVPLYDRVCYKKTTVSGGTVASYYTYGLSGNSLGELVTQQDTIGGTLVTTDTRTYDSLGRVLTSTGPNGESTTFAYTQCAGQEPSSVTRKTNNSGGMLSTSYSGYDCVGEKATITTDANGNQSSVNHGSDPFWRPVSTTDGTGIVTNLTYTAASGSSPATIDKQMTIASGSSEETLTQFDSMGRVKLSQLRQGPSSGQWTITETDYDANGRVKRVTLPYSGAAGTTNATIDGTTTTYDGLGRVKTVTGPAYNGTIPGSTLTYTYSANDVLATQGPKPSGENVKSRQTEYNGLGEITSVCEITSMTGSGSCGQTTAATGFLTTYAYYPAGNLKTITQYANGTPQQVRSFTYDNFNTGRQLTVQTPESGLVTTTYDSGGGCSTFVGFLVALTDNAGIPFCYSYDLADRLVGFGTYAPNPNPALPPTVWGKSYIYDSTSNQYINCGTTPNQAGRIAEAITSYSYGGGLDQVTTQTDEGFCYDADGRPTDAYMIAPPQILGNPPPYVTHVNETYFANGQMKTLSLQGEPTITYTLDPMGRVNSASDGTNTLVSSTSYFLDNQPNIVTFSANHKSTYNEFANFAPSTLQVKIGSGNNNSYTLNWNSNGTIKKLTIADVFNPSNSQTCTFSYDDLTRLKTDNCGTNWNESYSYDPFGNVTKSGSFPWPPGGYDQTTNRYASAAFTYDANGRLTNDTFDSLNWDRFGNLYVQGTAVFYYDAFDRIHSSSTTGGGFTQFLYAPDGSLVGAADNTGTTQKMFVPLPKSRAVYQSSTLSYFDHFDWQGSSRIASTPSNSVFSDTSYDAFGMPYWSAGTPNQQFADLSGDFSSGTELVSETRRYHPSQGRWQSPDDGIPDPYAPQTLNAYHYALNMPTVATDPTGQQDWIRTGICVGDGCPPNASDVPPPIDPISQEDLDAEDAEVNYSNGLASASQGIQQTQAATTAIVQQMAQMDLNRVSNMAPGTSPLFGSGPVGAPGFAESLIPIWGSGRAAINDFQTGHWGWGIANAGIAVSDVFLVKSLGTAAVKVGVRGLAKVGGSAAWDATREWMMTQGWKEVLGEGPYHHWLIPQNQWGKIVPEVVKNQPWNIMGTGSRAFHNAIEGKGVLAMGMGGRLWFGSPTWAKVLLGNSLMRGAAHYEPQH